MTLFADAIAINVSLLKFSGVVPRRSTLFLTINWQYLMMLFSVFSTSIYTISYGYAFIASIDYLEEAMEYFTMLISFFGGEVRYLSILFRRERVRKIFEICEDLWTDLDNTERQKVCEYVNKIKRLTYCYLGSCTFTIFFYVATGFVLSVLLASPTGNETMTKTLPYTLAVDVHRSPYFEIAYVFEIVTITNAAITFVGTDTIGPLLLITASGHFKVIQDKLEALADQVDVEDKENEKLVKRRFGKSVPGDAVEIRERTVGVARIVTANVKDKLNTCINHHRAVMRLCNNVEELTSLMFLTQLLGSTYNIGIVGFKLASNDPDKIKFAGQISVAIVQLFLCNWPPDILLSESAAVANAAYYTPWHRYTDKIKRSILFIIMRSQRPVRVTAGYFVTLSLETFASMVSTAASFFTMLSTVN